MLRFCAPATRLPFGVKALHGSRSRSAPRVIPLCPGFAPSLTLDRQVITAYCGRMMTGIQRRAQQSMSTMMMCAVTVFGSMTMAV